MKRSIRTLLILFITLIWTGPLPAETLDDYLKIAGENNPALKGRYYEYLAALEQVPQAGSLPDPQLTLNFLLEPMARYPGEQVGDIALMQMFPWFGSLKAAEEEASLMAKARFEAFQEAKLNLYDDVRQAWLDLYRIERDVILLEEDIKILRELEELAMTRFQIGSTGGSGMGMAKKNSASGKGSSGSGMGGMPGGKRNGATLKAPDKPRREPAGPNTDSASGMADVLRVQLQIQELKNDLQILEKNRKPLQVGFNRLLNRPDEIRIDIAENLSEIPLPDSIETIKDAIRLYHPMIKMYEWEAQAGESGKTMAKLRGRPTIGLGLNYSIFQPRDVGPDEMGPMNNGKDMIMPMVTITLPIYRKKNDAMLKQARHRQTENLLKKEAAENDLFSDLESLIWDYESAASRINLYTSQIETTRTLMELLTTAYMVAGSDFEELLRTQQILLNYERSLIRSVTDQHKTVSGITRLMSRDLRTDH